MQADLTGIRLPDDVAHAYLDRLGVDVAPGRIEAHDLARLQRAHLERVPYENLDIVLGRPPGIDPVASARRVVAGRGGYCYHLNGAFSALLEWLGVDVTRRLAGVQGSSVEQPVGLNRNHLALTVRLDGTEWLVDVGLGDGPTEPLPLELGVHDRNGYRYTLGPSSCGEGIWRFDHDERGSFRGFDVDARTTATIDDFQHMHAQLSTDSGFTRTVTAMRWVGQRLELLRGCVLTELGTGRTRTRDIAAADDWWGVVIDGFGLAYMDLADEDRKRLWTFVRDGHEAWDAAGRP